MNDDPIEIIDENEEMISFSFRHSEPRTADGHVRLEKAFRVHGEVWEVHKFDADPFPSNPHAHCIDGRGYFKGAKLHLGTGQLFKGPHPTDYFYPRKDFLRLCELLGRKFPGLTLPLAE